jgi:hypothetical protein
MTTSEKVARPKWWNGQHDSAWNEVKDVARREWEQSRQSSGERAPSRNQDMEDAVSQVSGRRAGPAGDQSSFEDEERALRFGYGARLHFGEDYPAWNQELEHQLEEEWEEDWLASRDAVRHGWEFTDRHERVPAL